MPYIYERDQQSNRSNIPKPVKFARPSVGYGVNHASRPSLSNIPDTPAKVCNNDYKLPQKAPPALKKKTIEINPEIPALELKPFAEQPIVDFGEVNTEQTRVNYVTIRNLQNIQQRLVVKSFPKQENGFSIDSTDFLIAPKTEIFVALAWTPKSVGPIRDSVTFQDVNRSTFRVVMIGRAVRPKLQSTIKSSSKINAKVQSRPTPAKTNRYSPSKMGRKLNLDKTQLLFSPRTRSLLNKGVNIKPLTKLKANNARRRDSGQIVINILSKNNDAVATRVQSFWRMVLAKRHLAQRREDKATIIRVQSLCRMVLAKRSLATKQQERGAIIKIQNFWRMTLAKRLLARKQQENAATIKIQKFWRMVLAKRRYAKKLEQKANVIRIQSLWRMVLAKRLSTQKQREREAIIKIQNFWRSILAKRLLTRKLQERAATIKIQNFWRMILAKRLLAQKQQESVATIKIQNFWRMVLAKRLLTQKRQDKAALIKIQIFWRMVIAKRQLAEKLRHKAAVIRIQSLWRMVLARRLLAQKREDMAAIINIQSTWRMVLSKRELGRDLDTRIDALSRVKNRWVPCTSQRVCV